MAGNVSYRGIPSSPWTPEDGWLVGHRAWTVTWASGTSRDPKMLIKSPYQGTVWNSSTVVSSGPIDRVGGPGIYSFSSPEYLAEEFPQPTRDPVILGAVFNGGEKVMVFTRGYISSAAKLWYFKKPQWVCSGSDAVGGSCNNPAHFVGGAKSEALSRRGVRVTEDVDTEIHPLCLSHFDYLTNNVDSYKGYDVLRLSIESLVKILSDFYQVAVMEH